MASAIIDRAELPVQRKRTLQILLTARRLPPTPSDFNWSPLPVETVTKSS
jgi:hypothetical protein